MLLGRWDVTLFTIREFEVGVDSKWADHFQFEPSQAEDFARHCSDAIVSNLEDLEQNIALAMVAVEHTAIGTKVGVVTGQNTLAATVVERPFYDPKKTLAAS